MVVISFETQETPYLRSLGSLTEEKNLSVQVYKIVKDTNFKTEILKRFVIFSFPCYSNEKESERMNGKNTEAEVPTEISACCFKHNSQRIVLCLS